MDWSSKSTKGIRYLSSGLRRFARRAFINRGTEFMRSLWVLRVLGMSVAFKLQSRRKEKTPDTVSHGILNEPYWINRSDARTISWMIQSRVQYFRWQKATRASYLNAEDVHKFAAIASWSRGSLTDIAFNPITKSMKKFVVAGTLTSKPGNNSRRSRIDLLHLWDLMVPFRYVVLAYTDCINSL
jgi:hypothetical protein